MKRNRQSHPGSKAHYAVARAARAGRLTRPVKCTACNRKTRLHAHHNSYDYPLEVVHLCASCHALPAQELRLKEYANKLKYPYEYHSMDESAFGFEREEFTKLIRDVQRRATKEHLWIVFDKCDRMSRRSSQEAVRILQMLTEAGRIQLHFPHDNMVLTKDSAATEWFHLDINLSLGGYYSRAISNNVRRKFGQLLAEGNFPHRAPIGYLNQRITEKETTIIKDPVRSPFVVRAFKLRAEGMSYEAIANDLKDRGFRSHSGRTLPKSTIAAILANKFYCGIMTHDGREYPHKYEMLISWSLYNKCQSSTRDRSNGNATKYGTTVYTLSKITNCGRCGRTVSSYTKKGHVYLRCAATGAQSCGNPNSSEKVLIQKVEQDIGWISATPENWINQIVEKLKEKHGNQQEMFTASVAALRKEYDSLNTRLNRIYDDRLDGRITVERHDELARQYQAKQKEINEKLEALTNGNVDFQITASYLLDLAQKASQLFASSKAEQKQAILAFMLSNVTMDNKELSYEVIDPYKSLIEFNKKGAIAPSSTFWQGLQDDYQTYCGLISFPDEEGHTDA